MSECKMDAKSLITSVKNDKINELKKVLADSKKAKKLGFFVVEGARIVQMALESDYEVSTIFATKNSYEKYHSFLKQAKNIEFIAENVADSITKTCSNQGIFAKVLVKSSDKISYNSDFSLLLDRVQNPDNLGSIIRSAAAFGAKDVFVSENSASIYNDKCIRASMGSLFKINIFNEIKLEDAILSLQKNGIKVLSSTLNEKSQSILSFDFPAKMAIIIGNEGSGISQNLIDLSDESIHIPMSKNAESLNASVATAILLYEASKNL